MRKKDVVLMATVSSFEGLPHPTKSELRQFAELFSPLFTASSEEARRQAVAALSQSTSAPPAVAFFIASQPIAIAAPFLMASACLTDEALIAIARTQGIDHARAIVRRETLSPTVIDALAGMRHDRVLRQAETTDTPPNDVIDPARETDAARMAREDELRRRIKLMAGHVEREAGDRLGLRSLSPVQEALLVRFARNREAGMLAAVLADVLTTSRWLAERIMLDLSGRQLAVVLKSLGMAADEAGYVLTRLYGHLSETVDGETRLETLWASLDENDCIGRVEAWRKADRYTHGDAEGRPATTRAQDLAETQADEAMAGRLQRTSASIRRSVGGRRA
jgi:uncharacterized protein (DUF2336 family)